ncbi:TonB-dependent receptor [Methylocystis bryophila]|uniref:TonB-dependent receptor n=2 Tax=Methylocystis bryophila TaxID=655015 RepID=A0A1W6N0R6_9HYPH|nr:TonB-dependent receptor [Methylocystis bryophila]
MSRLASISLATLAGALTQAAQAQTALPDINVSSPLRAHPRPAPAAQPVVSTPHPAAAASPTAPVTRRAVARAPAPTPAQSPSAQQTSAASPAPFVAATTPAAINITSAKEIEQTHQFDVAKALERAATNVIIEDVQGNPFSPQVDFRGFAASPVSGTPQGLAVYMNGIRINEAWGDTVNWDLIPTVAIDRTAIVTGNPLFGLNAIGGAVVMDMKNGFTYHGFELDGRGGSFGRRQGAMQAGVEQDGVAAYVAIEAAGDKGYRKFSGSQIHRLYGDLGWRGDQAEIHLSTNIAANKFGVSASAPNDLVNNATDAVYTTPQTTKNTLSQFDLNGVFTPQQNWKILADAHYRAFDQAHVDGNTTDFASCGGPTLCDNNGNSTYMPDFFGPNAALAAIDRTWTTSRTVGGTVQIENTDKLGFSELPNKIVFGVNLEHGWTHFAASEELGLLNPYDLSVPGLGVINLDPAGDVSPVKLNAANTYLGVYALDTFEATDKLTFTAGARYNLATISLYDLYSTQLNGSSSYDHLNPVVGATYKITQEVAAYASYSESNRAPTPLELGCADPNHPCLIDNFLVSDPHLSQVVAHSIETGLRGGFHPASYLPAEAGALLPGRVDWSAGVYRTTSFNDILSVPSQVTGQGYFTNAGVTQRQGIETQVRYTDEKLSAYVNYALTDATFRSMLELGSPNNPLVVAYNTATGLSASSILVMPGSHMTSIPKHRLKGGFDYALTKEWKVGMDVVYTAGNWVRGDEINAFGTLPSYATVNLRSSYQLTKNFQVYGLIDNVGGARGRSFGTFFNTTQIPFLSFSDPRQVSITAPTGFYAGAKMTF